MTTILSPAGAVESLLKSGVRVSERELRAKAKRLGCYRQIGRAVESAGLDPDRVTPHVCRHSWATWFYAQTLDPMRLKVEGGWKSAEWERYVKIATPGLGRLALEAGWDFRAESGEDRGRDRLKA